MIVSQPFTPVWRISFAPGYLVSAAGQVYHRGHLLRRVYNGGCRGYYIQGKFYSLTKLRQCLEKYTTPTYPF